jgi:drug/metabolite transporter (DMT)-like permease
MHGNDRKYWLDDPANVTKLYRGVWVVGVLLVALDVVLQRHDDLGFAETWGFYALYGFVGIVSLVLTAKGLRRLVKRPEDFYEH